MLRLTPSRIIWDRYAAPSGTVLSLGVSAVEIYEASVSLMVRAMVVSARWAARTRALSLERACARGEAGRVAQLEARVMRLEDAVAFRDARLEVLERRLGENRPRRPYPLLDRLRLLWLIEYVRHEACVANL